MTACFIYTENQRYSFNETGVRSRTRLGVVAKRGMLVPAGNCTQDVQPVTCHCIELIVASSRHMCVCRTARYFTVPVAGEAYVGPTASKFKFTVTNSLPDSCSLTDCMPLSPNEGSTDV